MNFAHDIKLNEQHVKIVQLVNDLVDLAKTCTNEDSYKLIPKLAIFSVYLERHFQYENALMLEYNFSGYAQHKELHRHFLSTVHDMYNKSLRDPTVIKDTVGVLSNGITNHLAVEAKMFSEFAEHHSHAEMA